MLGDICVDCDSAWAWAGTCFIHRPALVQANNKIINNSQNYANGEKTNLCCSSCCRGLAAVPSLTQRCWTLSWGEIYPFLTLCSTPHPHLISLPTVKSSAKILGFFSPCPLHSGDSCHLVTLGWAGVNIFSSGRQTWWNHDRGKWKMFELCIFKLKISAERLYLLPSVTLTRATRKPRI